MLKRSPEGFGCPPRSPTAFLGPGAVVRHCLEIRNVEQAPDLCTSECAASAGLGGPEEKKEQEMLPGGGHIAPEQERHPS